MLSHDLTNKLSAVVSHCDLLEADYEADSPAFVRAEKIKHLALAMIEMVQVRECDLLSPVSATDSVKELMADS